MTVIRIRQHEGDTEDLQATVSFNEEGDYPITLRNPFSPAQEEQLEWYFEKHLEYPFLDDVKARTGVRSLFPPLTPWDAVDTLPGL